MMNQRARGRRWLAGLLCCCLLLAVVFSALAATYPYETVCIENVNLRKSASGSATILKRVEAGASVKILGVSGTYYKIEFDGVTGYAVKNYVDGTSPGAETPPVIAGFLDPPVAVDSYPYDTNVLARVKFRKTAEDMATILSLIPQDAIVTVQGVAENGYAKVRYDGKTGYVNSGFLNLAVIATPAPKPTPTPDPAAAKYTLLQTGSSGEAVRALQNALTELKYYEGVVDAKYGAKTQTAVNAFKKRNGMAEDGIADGAMQKLLYEGTPKDTRGYRQNIKTLAPLADVAIASGNIGEPVEKLQRRLKELGYYLGEINGTCDKATVTAIKDFQQKHFLGKTGTADIQTQSVLYGATALSASAVAEPTPKPTVVPPKGVVKEGDRGDDAKAVQQRLKDLGYYTGKVDGRFSAASVKALKAFQEKSKLKQDGVCGVQTRAVLWGENAPTAVATAMPVAAATAAPLTPETTVIIQSGSRGNAVLNLQLRLSELGYYSSRQDGVYLEDDISAVRAFQKANGLKVDGKAGYETQSILFNDAAVRGTLVQTGVTLRYGSSGDGVTALQNRLKDLGYLTEAADGKFGISTKTALLNFQKAHNLSRDGVAGAQTQAALFGDAAVKNTVSTAETLKEGSVSASVKDLQTKLISLGYLTGTADGKFGAKTTLALMEFQKRNSLKADGVAGKTTLDKLNNNSAKAAAGVQPTPKPGALQLTGAPSASSVRYANWYSEIRAHCKQYPNVTIYDFITGISWQVNLFSLGAHADGEPISANDTANMNRAFGGKTTWTPKPVWVVFSDGRVYMATTHNTPHETSHNRTNDFAGHLCVHFPRTMAQVEAIGPYATSHQKAVEQGWQATQALARR